MAITLPGWLGGATTSVKDDRAVLNAMWLPGTTAANNRGGILPSPTPANSTIGSGTITISAFRALVVGTVNASTGQGAYVVTNDAPVTLSATPSSTSLFRRDRLVVEVLDTENGGASNGGQLRLVPGTPNTVAASATLPAVPANVLELYQVLVAPNGGITLTDTRTYTGLVNGITTVSGAELTIAQAGPVNTPYAGFSGSYDGQYRDHPFYGLQRWSANTNLWMPVAGGYVGAHATSAAVAPGGTYGFEAARFTANYAGQRYQAVFQGLARTTTANATQTIAIGLNTGNPGQNWGLGQSSLDIVDQVTGGPGPEARAITRVFDFTATSAGVVIINLLMGVGGGATSIQMGNWRTWITNASAFT